MAPKNLNNRFIHYEPEFVGDSFRNQPFCKEALQMIANSDLMALTRLPKLAYPRIIKAFYSTLELGCDGDSGEAVGWVTIDGTEYVFSHAMIARALGIKKYTPIEYSVPDLQMEMELSVRPKGSGKDKEVRESFLHENMWLVAKFMRTYVFPFTHGQIIPKYTLKYVHGMSKGKGVDVPQFLMDMMMRSRDSGRKGVPHGLVCGRTITAILKYCKHTFQANEEFASEMEIGVFDYEWVKRSMETLAEKNNLVTTSTKKGKGAAGSSRSVRLSEVDDEMEGNEAAQEGGEGHANANANAENYSGTGSQQQHYWPPQNQWEAHMRGQEQVLANQGQMFEMLQGMNLNMQGYGSMLEGVQGTVQEMQGTLRSLDSRVQGLETRWGTTQTYQRRRKSTITFEEEHGEEPRE